MNLDENVSIASIAKVREKKENSEGNTEEETEKS